MHPPTPPARVFPRRRRTYATRPRAGFTLIEMLIALAVCGLLLAIVGPKLQRIGDKNKLRSSRDELTSMIATARAAAIQKGREARFYIKPSADSVYVVVDTAAGKPMVIVASRSMQSLYGVTLAVAPSPGTDAYIPFDARGFSSTLSGNTVRIRVTHAQAGTDSVCVTKFGLILKRGCLTS